MWRTEKGGGGVTIGQRGGGNVGGGGGGGWISSKSQLMSVCLCWKNYDHVCIPAWVYASL